MDHLFASTVKVQRMQLQVVEGRTPYHDWVDQPAPLNAVKCRLDLLFVRVGKDAPPAQEAGAATNRQGVMFCSASVPIQAGDRIVTTAGPVDGTFEIKNIPDRAVDFGSAHHIEVQVFETNQTLAGPTSFPSEVAPPEPIPEVDLP